MFHLFLQDLLPIEENGEVKGEKPKVNNESIEYASDDYRKLVEVNQLLSLFKENMVLYATIMYCKAFLSWVEPR